MNIIIYTVVILTIFYFLLKFISNISSKKISKSLRYLIILGLIILAILFAIGGRFLLTLPLTLASLALLKLKGLSIFQLISLYRLIQTLKRSGRFSFNNSQNNNSSTLSVSESFKILNLDEKKKLIETHKLYFYLLCGPEEDDNAQKIIQEIGTNFCESLSDKSISEVKDYISLSDIYVGNDSFGHHISCQMGKPSFIILLDTPRAYSDYSTNQKRILPPNINLDEVTHDSKFDPNLISVNMIINEIKKFI